MWMLVLTLVCTSEMVMAGESIRLRGEGNTIRATERAPVLYSRYTLDIYDFHDSKCTNELLDSISLRSAECIPVPYAFDVPYESMIFHIFDAERNSFIFQLFPADECVGDSKTIRFRGDGCQASIHQYETLLINFRIQSPIIAPCTATIFDEAG